MPGPSIAPNTVKTRIQDILTCFTQLHLVIQLYKIIQYSFQFFEKVKTQVPRHIKTILDTYYCILDLVNFL